MRRKHRPLTPDLFTPRCDECGLALVVTESGYLCCPKGHGRLHADPTADLPDAEPCGLWFTDEPLTA